MRKPIRAFFSTHLPLYRLFRFAGDYPYPMYQRTLTYEHEKGHGDRAASFAEVEG